MELGALIKYLENKDPNQSIPQGFGSPNSYRGYYEQVAFKPEANTTIGKMLEHAKSALGQKFFGWKGGEYEMHEYTDTWLADYGDCGDAITLMMLNHIVGESELLISLKEELGRIEEDGVDGRHVTNLQAMVARATEQGITPRS